MPLHHQVNLTVAHPATIRFLQKATLKVYKGAPHGLCTTHKDQVNADLLAFIQRGGARD